MGKRLLSANASDFAAMGPADLLAAIGASEGRTLAAESICIAPPLIDKVANAEIAAAFGADLLLLNFYDVTSPQVIGFPSVTGEDSAFYGHIPSGHGVTIAQVKRYTGRPVGLNLEPIENAAEVSAHGRLATADNALKAVEQGADFILVTGNPQTGVTREGIARSVKEIRDVVGDRVILMAGKMHAAGTRGPTMTADDVRLFVDAGAHVIALPAPGTVPGTTQDSAAFIIDTAHAAGALAMTTIGTSQEGSNVSTIEAIALMAKMAGADIHHIGDCGTFGVAWPDNITAYSMAIRGRRHTWHRMAASIRR
jgi:hypothetical protein